MCWALLKLLAWADPFPSAYCYKLRLPVPCKPAFACPYGKKPGWSMQPGWTALLCAVVCYTCYGISLRFNWCEMRSSVSGSHRDRWILSLEAFRVRLRAVSIPVHCRELDQMTLEGPFHLKQFCGLCCTFLFVFFHLLPSFPHGSSILMEGS